MPPTRAGCACTWRKKTSRWTWCRPRRRINGLHAGGEHVRNSHPAFENRALPGYAWATPQSAELADRSRRRYYEFLGQLDARLADNDFLAGEAFSVADITAFCAIDFWRKFRLPLPEDHSHLQRWHEAISARPSAAA